MEQSNGIRILKSIAWDDVDADVVIESNTCLSGLEFWYPYSWQAFFAHAPPKALSNLIFFLEALTVTSAFMLAVTTSQRPLKVIIYTDNSNMVSMFNSLHALSQYNNLLKHAVDLIISGDHELSVQFIPGHKNFVVDLISRELFDEAHKMFPLLIIEPFQLP